MGAFLPLLALAAAVGEPHPAALAGAYDGSQTEMAAALELLPNGRFRYMLSYGALDEQAAGSWRIAGHTVLLDSDPVREPRFILAGQSSAGGNGIHIDLQLPSGMDAQFFEAAVLWSDGKVTGGHMSQDGLSLPTTPGQRITEVRLALPMLNLTSEAFHPDKAQGLHLTFRFEPNDLGQVAFKNTPLEIDDDDLLLARHDREIRFRRAGSPTN